MNSKAASIRSAVAAFMARHGIPGEMAAKARQRQEDLAKSSTAKLFLDEMKRFLPAKRVAEMSDAGLHQAILADSGELIRCAVLRVPPE
jgi:hypothetical protein